MSVLTTAPRRRMSREEFARLPEGPPYYDYVNGEAVEVNRPTGRHQHVLLRLGNFLWEHVRHNGLGDVFPDIDVELPTGNVYGPDLVYLSTEHLDRYDEPSGDLYGAPDLVVEVLSPSTAAYDRGEKMDDYHRSGVPWIWLIDQETLSVEECEWASDGYVCRAADPEQPFRPRLFPDLEINMAQLMGQRA